VQKGPRYSILFQKLYNSIPENHVDEAIVKSLCEKANSVAISMDSKFAAECMLALPQMLDNALGLNGKVLFM
jgi:hypothetical protein